jgi:hypothetical protein
MAEVIELIQTATAQRARSGRDFEPRLYGVRMTHGTYLFPTKEVLVDQSPIGARLTSNAEAIANNRCLACAS